MKTELKCSLVGKELKCPFCKKDFEVDYNSKENMYFCPGCGEPIKVEATISFALIPPTSKEVIGKIIKEVTSKKTMDKEDTLRILLEFAGMPKEKKEEKK